MTSPTPLDTRTVNALWASVLVETLARAGVRRAVVSPGSRSTPLTLALARHGAIASTPVLDERSAAFFALGMAKAVGEPVVLVCTSGTAAANYFPAIVEAHESNVPLVVITADRPPEMRASASGQTIDQLKLFGGYVAFFHELALPELDLGRLRYLRQIVLHAGDSAAHHGPVHLNAPFRDPLAPIPDGGATEAFARAVDWTAFFAKISPPAPCAVEALSALPPEVAREFLPEAHGLIVVGPNQPTDGERFAAAIGEVAARLGWPVLADGLTPLRSHASLVPNLVTAYDTILRNGAAAERLRPEVVLCVGEWPTSKVLRSWLEKLDASIWMATPRSDNRDALHGRTRRLPLSLEQLGSASGPGLDGGARRASALTGAYAGMWLRYEQQARSALDRRLAGTAEFVESKLVPILASHLPEGAPVVIANSMPIRDVEYFWPANDRHTRILCNRGANGIDGTLSTALGVAEASGQPSVLLTGDLALLHDTNGFLIASKIRASLTVVLVNNAGGGIFEHLPIAQFEAFEAFFATPQVADFARLASAYGVSHTVVADEETLRKELATPAPAGVRVLELKTDRKRDSAWRQRVFREVAAELG